MLCMYTMMMTMQKISLFINLSDDDDEGVDYAVNIEAWEWYWQKIKTRNSAADSFLILWLFSNFHIPII